MVHDAVRPVCDRDTMRRVLDAAWETGAAVPGLPATETIQRVSRKGRVLATPPREELFAIQTPQAFHAGILRSALDRAGAAGFVGTDESSVVRWAGHPVVVVPGSPDNIKITRPMDLEIAERLISGSSRKEDGADMSESTLRVGQGIDFHRLVEGRKLILGGVEIPFERGTGRALGCRCSCACHLRRAAGRRSHGRHRAALSGYRSGAPEPVQPRISARGENKD